MKAPPTPQKDGQRINRDIRVREVQLIDQDGQNRGVVEHAEALQMAEEAGLDLVEIVPNANPPVCKILDYGKFKFQEQKKAAEARKKQKVIEIKEIKMRPTIDDHDYDVKMRAIHKFIGEGDKVKVTLRFRGREMAHQEFGMRLLERVKGDLEAVGVVEQWPKMEGRQLVMVLGPKKKVVPVKGAPAKVSPAAGDKSAAAKPAATPGTVVAADDAIAKDAAAE